MKQAIRMAQDSGHKLGINGKVKSFGHIDTLVKLGYKRLSLHNGSGEHVGEVEQEGSTWVVRMARGRKHGTPGEGKYEGKV